MNTTRTKTFWWAMWAMLLILATAPTSSAHHSAAASYDADRSIEIQGTGIEFAWRNPHSHLYINVAVGPFKGRTYSVELSSAVSLSRSGWTRTLLRPGDRVTMAVNPSRTDLPVGLCRNCVFTVNGKPGAPRTQVD